MKIRGFILTRDSYIFLWGKIVGAALLITSTLADPTFAALDLSAVISPLHLHQLQAIAGAVTVISAQLSKSALPGKADADKVSLPVKEQK